MKLEVQSNVHKNGREKNGEKKGVGKMKGEWVLWGEIVRFHFCVAFCTSSVVICAAETLPGEQSGQSKHSCCDVIYIYIYMYVNTW